MAVAASLIFITLWCSVLWFLFGLFLKSGELSPRIRLYAVLWGALGAVLLTIPIQTLIGIASAKVYKEREVWEFFNGVFAGPPIEEIVKGLFPLFACLSLGIKGRRALLVLGAMSGLGFFFTESFCAAIAAILHGTVNDWTHELSGRVFSLGHQHAMYTGFVGLGIACAATRKNWFERIGFVLLGLAIGVGFHSTFNALAQAIDAGQGKEGWAYTWSVNRKLISIYIALLVVAIYRREKAHWTAVLAKKSSPQV